MNLKQSSLALYLHDIGKYPLLTAEQELELGKKIKENGDQFAREQLINSNLRLVVSVAKSYKNANNNVSMEDLISFGNCGLVTAADKFDYTYGYRFSTCAVPWIKQAIGKGIADTSRVIRIPAHIIQAFNKEKNVRQDLECSLNREPTGEEIAKAMGITIEQLDEIYEWKKNSISLSTPLGDDSDDTLEDISADEGEESPVDYAEKSLLHDTLSKMIAELDPRTKAIVKLRFGIYDAGDDEIYKTEHTLEEIGELLTPHITRERVRQILVAQLTKWKLSCKDSFTF